MAALATLAIGAAAPTIRALKAVASASAFTGASAQAGTVARAAAASCPDANLIPRPGNLERIRAATECLVNRVRERYGERPLRANARLQAAAQGHSDAMASDDFFEHDGPGGNTPLERMRASGYASAASTFEVGENIAWGTLWLSTPSATVAAWMASPGHRANILDAHFRDTAVGVCAHPPVSLAHGQQGAVYTQDFGVILASPASRHARHAHPRHARAHSQHAHAHSQHAHAHPRHARGAPVYNLPRSATKRRHKRHGSTRRKVRHRHRIRTRHRPRHG